MFNDSCRLARALGALVFIVSATPVSAATHVVPAGGDLQAVINAAQPGDVIELEEGATYTGNFRLPVKNGTDFIVLRTGGQNPALPGPGARIHKRQAPLLAKIRSATSVAALTAQPGSHHWRVELVEFQANRNGAGDIIILGGGSEQTTLAQMPHTFIFDRVYVHGDPTVGQKRGLTLNSGSTQVINSYFEDFKVVGQDSQAMGGWNGTGPYLIENNHIEAAGENVLFGGADATIPDLVPSDITIRRNVMTKPLAWRNERWQVKNAFELKNARRVLIEGNVFENVWAQAQTGYAIVFTVRNQSGRAPWSVIEDVTFRYNVIRHSGAAFNILGYDNNHPSQQAKRISISHNLIYDVNHSGWGGPGHFLQIGAMAREIYVENNTVLHSGHALGVYGGKTPTGGHAIEGVVFRNNVLRHNTYGVKGEATTTGNDTLNRFLPGIVFEQNVLAGGRASQYPPGNYFPTVDEFEAQFVDLRGENFELVPGSSFRGADSRPLGADLRTMNHVMNGGSALRSPTAPTDEIEPDAPMNSRRPGRY